MAFAAEASMNYLLERINEHIDELKSPRHKCLMALKEVVVLRSFLVMIAGLFMLPSWQQLHRNEHSTKPKPPLEHLHEGQQTNHDCNDPMHETLCLQVVLAM